MTVRRLRRGFTLIEAVLALVLATLLFGGIALYTGSWARQWERIIERGGRHDTVAVVLDRIVEDLEAAQPILVDGPRGKQVVFEGKTDSVVFVRRALGFDARAGLDRITYVNAQVAGSAAITRSRRDHGGLDRGGEDLPLMRGAARLRFSYAGEDGALSPTWNDARGLPTLIRVEIAGETPRAWAEAGFARPRVRLMANCGTAAALPECVERLGSTR
jgi:general secretion pathway protein J